MDITLKDGTLLEEFAPAAGSRDGWGYKTYLRCGRAKLSTSKRGGFDHYGIYGARRKGDGWELYLQYEGGEYDNGTQYGRPLLVSSMDSDPYLWHPASSFVQLHIFRKPNPAE